LQESDEIQSISDDSSGCGAEERAKFPAWIREAESILAGDYAAKELAKNPALLDDINLKDLRADLFPHDRILAEIILRRDQELGLLHPESARRLTAQW
jgi:hypothetical protein